MGDSYETPRLLAEYLLFHYGRDEEVLPWDCGPQDALGFPARTVAHFAAGDVARGLDLGCAVGRSTYEMSRNCQQVIGIDSSRSFIAAASQLQTGQPVIYQRHDEGHSTTSLQAKLPQGVHPERTSFEVGDVMNLRPGLGNFERVHAANLLCRLSEPQRLLDQLPMLVKPGGQLVLATPCTWLAEFTPPERWPQGSTFDWLHSLLAPHFRLRHLADEPFLIRETARKYQWTISQVSVWDRRPDKHP